MASNRIFIILCVDRVERIRMRLKYFLDARLNANIDDKSRKVSIVTDNSAGMINMKSFDMVRKDECKLPINNQCIRISIFVYNVCKKTECEQMNLNN